VATRTHHTHRYFAPLAKYFTVCITYQPAYVLTYDAQKPKHKVPSISEFYNSAQKSKETVMLKECDLLQK